MGNNASTTMFGSRHQRCCHHHCCWVVFVIFSEDIKELVLELFEGLAGKLALPDYITEAGLMNYTLL